MVLMRKREIMDVAHRNWYWTALKTVWKEYNRDHKHDNCDHLQCLENFYQFCEDRWGFKVEQSEHGVSGIAANYKVLNEGKFDLFQLKYSNV